MSIESIETGLRPDYTLSRTGEEFPQGIEERPDAGEAIVEVVSKKFDKNPPMVKRGAKGPLGHIVVGNTMYFAEAGPEGEWVVGTRTLPQKNPKEQ